jgi:1-acyl-sn-glycerol-3-phosphate acyltransferase
LIVIRSLLFQCLFYLWTTICAVAGLPFMLTPHLWMMRFGTFWSRIALALLKITVGLDHEIRGSANLPAGPMLIAMKHQSAWDTFAAPVLFRLPAMVIKRELGYVPFYGWYALKAGMIPVDRSGGGKALLRMVEDCKRALADNRPILIFPEGTRSAVGAKVRYQAGVAALYSALDVPLVPVAVNSGLYWGRRSFSKRPGRIVVEILPPIAPGGDRRAALKELEARIEGTTNALVAEATARGASANCR